MRTANRSYGDQKPVIAPCSLFYNTRSRRIKAAEYTVSFYLLKFALQTCIVTAQSHFITTVRKKTRKKLKLFSCLFIEVGMQGNGRWIGLDLSKKTYEMCYFDQKGKVGRSGGETTKGGRAKLYAKLKAEDIVAMEVNSLAFVMEKEMRVIGCTVVILDASQLSIIYSSTKKTDKEDALKLARLVKIYEKEDLPIVDVPTEKEYYRRKLTKECKTLKDDRTQEIGRASCRERV